MSRQEWKAQWRIARMFRNKTGESEGAVLQLGLDLDDNLSARRCLITREWDLMADGCRYIYKPAFSS